MQNKWENVIVRTLQFKIELDDVNTERIMRTF
jgi:hypothetical protein